MEVCPSLYLERVLEDHVSVGEAYNAWPITGDYRFELRVLDSKYDLFNKAAVCGAGMAVILAMRAVMLGL